jgi:uncharacterized membrane protein YjjP (DUF1212 family)
VVVPLVIVRRMSAGAIIIMTVAVAMIVPPMAVINAAGRVATGRRRDGSRRRCYLHRR